MFEINLDIIKKYDRPGPRYTSYPTAPLFHEQFTSKHFTDEVIATNQAENPSDISLYFHLPYCDTLCYFCGCNMIITRNRDRVKQYVNYLKKEMNLLRGHLNSTRNVTQLHWGGGTPTHLNPDEIADLASYIQSAFHFTDNSENSCEIDPRGLTFEHLQALRKNGFNRISMGVQDFNPQVQKAVNRIQPETMTTEVVGWIRQLGFESLNLDLIYGLPFQTAQSFSQTVDRIIAIAPDRIAVFNYAHVPWMKKHMGLIHAEDIPAPEEKLEILKMTAEKLVNAGYVFIGMDHFAKPDDELAVALNEKKLYRNFQGYSTHAGADLYALGITSISQLKNVYAQNFKTEKEYYQLLEKNNLPVAKGYRLSDDDQIRRYVIMKLMCDFELDISDVEHRFNIDFAAYFSKGIQGLEIFKEDDLVTIDGSKIVVKGMGQFLIRNIAINFDGYIERNQDTAKYSKTV